MGNPRSFLALATVLIGFCCPSFASNEYVIVNNGNYISNSAILYRLNTKTGRMAKVAVLRTGGEGTTGEFYVGQVEQAVSAEAGCIFVLDGGSSDIAAFSKATSYQRVGRYFNPNLIAGTYGGSLALAPGGQLLYAGYSESGNIGVWKVKSDCTIALAGTYADEHGVGPIAVTPDGKYLVESSAESFAALFRGSTRTTAVSLLSGQLALATAFARESATASRSALTSPGTAPWLCLPAVPWILLTNMRSRWPLLLASPPKA